MTKPILYSLYKIMNSAGVGDVEGSEVRGSFYSWPKVATDIPSSAVPGHVPMQCSEFYSF